MKEGWGCKIITPAIPKAETEEYEAQKARSDHIDFVNIYAL